MSKFTPSPSMSNPATLAGAKNLQERLHNLLTKLSKTIEVIKDWPGSDGEENSKHVHTTSKLISSIMEVIVALESVEGVVKADATFRKSLKDCAVPINLLDLLDHGGGLNPDCFSRGLLRDALEQLAGLKRRKLALEMLGSAVQSGLNEKLGKSNKKQDSGSQKRRRENDTGEDSDSSDSSEGRTKKKSRGDD